MKARVGRTAESGDPSIQAADSSIESQVPGDEAAPIVDAFGPSSLPRVPAPDSSVAPGVASQQSALRADEPGEGGGDVGDVGDVGDQPTDGPAADNSGGPSNGSATSRRPTASEISHPVAADGSALPDADADGLTDAREAQLGTNPSKADSDSDGLTDAEELAIRSDPTNPDTDIDRDGLTDVQERASGTNPTDSDTDDDGINDRLDRDPLRPLDSDMDGIPDRVERRMGLDPRHQDTDRDGLPDDYEVNVSRTDPTNPDSDGDGTNDFDEAWEIYNATQRDTDGDGLTDVEEARLGTDPTRADTDGDGLTDGREAGTGSLRDWTWKSGTGTDPLRADSDGDGFSDSTELGRGADPLDRGSQPLHESRPQAGVLSATGTSSTVAPADDSRPSVQVDAKSPMADGAVQRPPAWDGEQREFVGLGRVELPDAESTIEGEERIMGTPRDWWERDDVDPAQRTASDGSALESAEPATATKADGGSAAEPSTEAPPDPRTDGRLTDGMWYEPPEAPKQPTRGTMASSEGQTVTPTTDSDRPTLQAAQGDSSADATPGLTREGRVYLEDDPRRSGDEEPTLDDKAQVDLSDTAPDGTLLRQGLTDVFGNEISRSHDLGGGLPEGVAMPGADRLSGMMDPLAAAESDSLAGAVGGRGGGVDPRLAAPGGPMTVEVGEVEIVNPGGGGRIEVTVDEEGIEIVDPGASGQLEVTVDEEGIEIIDPGSSGEDEALPPEETEEEMPAFDDGISGVRHVEDVAWLDPNFGLGHPAEDPDYGQGIVVEGAAATSQRPPGGVVAEPGPPGGGYTDPPPSEGQPMGASPSGNPLNRDPGYVDPADTDQGGVPGELTDPVTGGRGGGPTEPAAGPVGTDDPRNAPTGGPAAQGGDTSGPGVGAPGAPSPGGGEVAVTEDEPQYGLGTDSAPADSGAADPLGMDTAAAPPAGEATAGPAPQGQQIGSGASGNVEPAITIDGGAVISMESVQVVPPPGAPPAPDLSGANLQSAGLGVADSSGLPASGPGLESSPSGAPAQPGTEDSGAQIPGAPGDDDGMP